MFIRRLIFSILFLIITVISVVFSDVKWFYIILMPTIPFLFYAINIFKLKIPSEYEMIFLVFITFGTVLGELWDLYYAIPLFDSILHGMAGPILCLVPMCFLVRNNVNLPRATKWFIILFVSMGFAAMWEIYEFTVDSTVGPYLGLDMQKNADGLGLIDTMHDMWIHLIGSMFFIVFSVIDEKKLNGKYTKKLEKIMLRETTEKIKEEN